MGAISIHTTGHMTHVQVSSKYYMINVLVIGDCASLQVAVTNRSGSTSCVGDMVTYTCTVPSIAHQWNIPSLGESVIVTRNRRTFSGSGDGSLSIALTTDEADAITTALSVTSFAGLNGANITCFDAIGGVIETQDTTAMVFGRCSIISRVRV